MLRHHHITEKAKPHLVTRFPQLFYENVPRVRRLQQRQPPVTTEGNKMQMILAVVAPQSRWHCILRGKKRPPQDPGSKNEPGAPSASLYFPEKCRSDILSTILMPTNKNFSESGPPAKTADGELFFMHSKRVTDYPKSVTVRLFGNLWELGNTVFDKRCSGNAEALMSSLQFKAEWKTELSMRPVSKMTVRPLKKDEMMPYPSLWGYELDISSEGVPLADHLIINVYGPDSSLIVRFSGAP
jgi:hypothetical protein